MDKDARIKELEERNAKKEEWEDRINALFQQVEYWISNIPDKTIETVELFY